VEENIASRNNIDLWNSYGIKIFLGSSNNTIRHNIISTNMNGILLLESSGNTILENDLASNTNYAIRTERASGNSIYHNNFIDNTGQVYNWEQQSINDWDDGYPSGGNYWSDYNGTDLHSGSYQNETGSDGIGDTSYIIDADNLDHFPLMHPYGSVPPALLVGDVTRDGTVDIFDLVKIVIAFGSDPTSQNWNPNCDLNGDEFVDILDLAIAAGHFGETIG